MEAMAHKEVRVVRAERDMPQIVAAILMRTSRGGARPGAGRPRSRKKRRPCGCNDCEKGLKQGAPVQDQAAMKPEPAFCTGDELLDRNLCLGTLRQNVQAANVVRSIGPCAMKRP